MATIAKRDTGWGRHVVVIGDVINDLIVRPLGPVTDDSDTRAEILAAPGGSAANVACWLGSLGHDVTFVGRVGAADCAHHTDWFARFGVEAHLAADPDVATGTIVVLVAPTGRRTMFVDRGANLGLVDADVPRLLLDGAAAVHLTGYSFFEDGVHRTAANVLATCLATDTPVTVDPSSVAFLRDVGPEAFLGWTRGAQICFPNRDEAALLAGTDDPMLGAARLTVHYATVVVTLDGDGAVVARAGEPPVLVPARRLHPLDTTGAGDAFCAGFLDRWCSPVAPEGSGGLDHAVDAAEWGVEVARRAVIALGGRPPELSWQR